MDKNEFSFVARQECTCIPGRPGEEETAAIERRTILISRMPAGQM